MSESKSWVDAISGINEEDLKSEEMIRKLILDHQRAILKNQAEITQSQNRIKELEDKRKSLKYGANTLIFEIAEQLELLNTTNGTSPFKPTTLNWTNFIPQDEINDAENFYYSKAVNLMHVAKGLDININKAMTLITTI